MCFVLQKNIFFYSLNKKNVFFYFLFKNKCLKNLRIYKKFESNLLIFILGNRILNKMNDEIAFYKK